MLIILTVVTIGLIIVWIEFKQLRENHDIKQNILFSLFLSVGMLLNLLNGFSVKTPSILAWLAIVYEPVYQLFNS